MKEETYKSILAKATFGYAYYRAVVDSKGIPVDYEFIEINTAFENFTGLKASEIIGKTVCEAIPGIKESNFDFTTHYDEIALQGGEKEFEQFFDPLNKWFKVQVSSPQKGYITTIFSDISFQYKLALVSQTFLTYTSESINYQYIIDTACEIAAAKYAAFNIFDEIDPQFTTVAFSGLTAEVKMVALNLGIHIPGHIWYYNNLIAERTKNKKTSFLSKVSQLTESLIDPKIVDEIAGTFDVGSVAEVKIEKQGKMLGSLTFIFQKEKQLQNQALLETYADMTSMLLDRLNQEREIAHEHTKFQQITNQITDIVWRTDLQFNNTYVSPSVEHILGFGVDEYLELPPHKRYPPQTLQMFQLNLQEELEKESQPDVDKHRTRTLEIEHYKADSSIVPIEVHVSFVRDETGLPVGIQGIARDITERKQAETELRKLTQAVEQSPASVVITNLEGNIEYVNPRFTKITGYTLEEARGQNPKILKSGMISSEVFRDLWETILAGKVWHGDLHNKKKNGELFWEASSISPIINSEGKITHYIAVKENITERKALEEDITRQNNLRKLLMEIASGFINIPLEDVDMAIQKALEDLGRFVSADRSYTFDYDWENDVCNNTYEWCADGITAEIENLQNVPLNMMQDWVEAHKKGESMYIPDLFQLPVGNVRDILEPQGVKSLLAVPMLTNSKCIGFVGFDSVKQHHIYSSADQQLLNVFAQVLANVKIRKEMLDNLVMAMQKIEESERKLKESQTIASLGAWELDADKELFTFNDNFYTMLHTNVAEMGGYEMTADEYARRFLFAEDVPLVAEQMENARIATNADVSSYLEHRIKYYDGVTGYIAVKYFITKDKNGKTIKTYGVNQDITERKLLELDLIVAKEKAEESSRLKTAFINNISHEIRTPLNGILGFGGFMMDESLSYDEKLDFYNLLQQSTSRLLQTITDIMDISELTTGTIIPGIADVQIANVLNSQVEKFRPRCNLKNIELITQIPVEYENLIIQTDEELLVKIVSQLVSNAEKFTSDGSIVLGFEVFDKCIRFFVTDTGKGIAEDKLEIIFEPFIQEVMSNTRGHEGNGLGLSIARKMLELIGGKIWVESQKGIGSTFFFEIPHEIEKVSHDLKMEDEPKTKITANKPFVLIAEDDDLNFVFFKTLLNRIDCDYKHANNGFEAVELCRQHPEIDLILMDIKMPVMNGIEATRLIREFRPELPIIAITAYAQTGDEQRFIEAGCNGYIAKPIKKDDLISLRNKYINIHQ